MYLIKFSITGVLLLAALTGCNQSDTEVFNRAIMKSEWNGPEKEIMLKMANNGNLTAMYKIGNYECVTGQNIECISWLEKAAFGGHYAAMQSLGIRLLNDPEQIKEGAILLMISLNFPTNTNGIDNRYAKIAHELSDENQQFMNQKLTEYMPKLDPEESTEVFVSAHSQINTLQKQWISFCNKIPSDVYCQMTVRPLPVELSN